MRKLFILSSLWVLTLPIFAQDEVLQKYTEMGDVNTTFITKSRLASMPLSQLQVPGLEHMLNKIESMKVLVSMGDKAGKQMGTKLPRQLTSRGYETRLSTEQDESQVTVLQSTRAPHSVVVIVYQKPHATVVSMRGDFSGEFTTE